MDTGVCKRGSRADTQSDGVKAVKGRRRDPAPGLPEGQDGEEEAEQVNLTLYSIVGVI